MAKYSIPKSWKGTARSAWDPAGADPLGINDKIFGGQDGPDYSEEEAAQAAAMADQKAATGEFIASGPARYDVGGEYTTEDLGPSEMQGITTDPRYREMELSALRDLENQSRDGFSATDRAAMARTEMEANRANRGRQGAIMQNMQARGMGGSGMDLVAQMSSAQDANDMEALRSLEREGQAQQLRQGATARMGSMATGLQGRDFSQAAQKAQAADRVRSFNTQLANSTGATNWERANNVADKNVGARANFSKDVYNARQGQGQLDYDYSAEGQNRKMLANAEAERKAAGIMGAAGGIVGGVVGGIYGGPQGAQAGATVGGQGGSMAGASNYRNQRYRSDEACKENIRNEHPLEIEAFLDSLSPKSFDYKDGEGKKNAHGVIAQDLEKSNIGRGVVVEGDDGMKNISMPDAISALFEAVSHLNRKMKG
jgi:hypothetical protein